MNVPVIFSPCRLIAEHNRKTTKLEAEIANHQDIIREKEAEIERLETELEAQRAANAKAPTTTMKNKVERLKNELTLKGKQHEVSIDS